MPEGPGTPGASARREGAQAALTSEPRDGSPLAALPKIDRVTTHPSLGSARARLGADALTRLARLAVEGARTAVRGGGACPSLDELAAEVVAAAAGALRARARPVINATGVVLHTNLGRAPLARRAVDALTASAGRYTSIELDLGTGRRGARAAFAEAALAQLTSAEAALVVNNNAAAVLLALGVLASGDPPGPARGGEPGAPAARKVVVSRGELIEIGGGFRVPEVCARSGATLVEVGTTNRTRLADYERALREGGVAAVLRVHPGNFRQTGFVERPSLPALAALCHAEGVPLVKDLGGGALVDLGPDGLPGEPTAQACIQAGCDLVCFSTDKVLGGPQGGVIAGRRDLCDRARRDPLARALRLGRLPLVALEATLACYLEGRLGDVPALAAVRVPLAAVRARAEAWQRALSERGIEAAVVELQSAMGGGSLAEEPLPSAGLALAGNAEALARRLRAGEPPVLARIQDGRLLLDARTVLAGEDEPLLDALAAAVTASG